MERFLMKQRFAALMEIPELKGIKHPSLDRLLELERLALRNKDRPRLSHLYRQ